VAELLRNNVKKVQAATERERQTRVMQENLENAIDNWEPQVGPVLAPRMKAQMERNRTDLDKLTEKFGRKWNDYYDFLFRKTFERNISHQELAEYSESKLSPAAWMVKKSNHSPWFGSDETASVEIAEAYETALFKNFEIITAKHGKKWNPFYESCFVEAFGAARNTEQKTDFESSGAAPIEWMHRVVLPFLGPDRDTATRCVHRQTAADFLGITEKAGKQAKKKENKNLHTKHVIDDHALV
jgi:hypothetical protein